MAIFVRCALYQGCPRTDRDSSSNDVRWRKPPEELAVVMEQEELGRRVRELNRRYDGVDGQKVLRALIENEFPGKIAV